MADNNPDTQKKIPWYQTDAFKTTATILVILMIPVAAFAWNVFSGNGSLQDLQDALNISSSETQRDEENAEDQDGDKEGENTDENQAQNNQNKSGAKNMPNTSAVNQHKVVSGDTIKSISLKYCKTDKSNFYYKNLDLELIEGETIKVNCNY